jgi:CHAT domain-containing protein
VPIHAAGVYDGPHPECCSDYVISSYTPTLAALLRAREDARAYKADQLKMLVIAVQDARDSDFPLPRLSFVRAEAASIVDVTSKAGISVDSAAESASRDEVSVLFNSKNMVHLACHGIQHPTLPHTSRFCLKDGSLTVLDLMNMELKDGFFAFLSACETAKGDVQHADESIHLAAAMLFAGFKSVVATMW